MFKLTSRFEVLEEAQATTNAIFEAHLQLASDFVHVLRAQLEIWEARQFVNQTKIDLQVAGLGNSVVLKIRHDLPEELIGLASPRRHSAVQSRLHRRLSGNLNLLSYFSELHDLSRLVVVLGSRVDAHNHFDLAFSIEKVLEQVRELRVSVWNFLALTGHVVLAQDLQAIAKCHQRIVDVSGFTQSLTGVLRAIGALAAGQVDQRKLRNDNFVAILHDVLATVIDRRLNQSNREDAVTAARLCVKDRVTHSLTLLSGMEGVESIFDRVHFQLSDAVDEHVVIDILADDFRLQLLIARRGRLEQIVYAVVVNLHVSDEDPVAVILVQTEERCDIGRCSRGDLDVGVFAFEPVSARIDLRLSFQHCISFCKDIESIQTIRFENKLLGLVVGNGFEQNVEAARHDSAVFSVACEFVIIIYATLFKAFTHPSSYMFCQIQ